MFEETRYRELLLDLKRESGVDFGHSQISFGPKNVKNHVFLDPVRLLQSNTSRGASRNGDPCSKQGAHSGRPGFRKTNPEIPRVQNCRFGDKNGRFSGSGRGTPFECDFQSRNASFFEVTRYTELFLDLKRQSGVDFGDCQI